MITWLLFHLHLLFFFKPFETILFQHEDSENDNEKREEKVEEWEGKSGGGCRSKDNCDWGA